MKTKFILIVLLGLSVTLSAADDKRITYGDNSAAGHYLRVGDAKIYYETYGSGHPLVLLHGGLFGYIDEFSGVIPELSRGHTVIAIALRGHGKSELGQQPLSNALFAEDAVAVIRHVTSEPVDLIGFSVGAMAAYLVTIEHPDIVGRLVAIGGPIDSPRSSANPAESNPYLDPAELEKQLSPQFISRRNKIYPDRAKWNRLVLAMGKAESAGPGVPKEKLKTIRCPTLIIGGDRDNYAAPDRFVEIYQLLPHAELAIVPGCSHTVFGCNPSLMLDLITQFIEKGKG